MNEDEEMKSNGSGNGSGNESEGYAKRKAMSPITAQTSKQAKMDIDHQSFEVRLTLKTGKLLVKDSRVQVFSKSSNSEQDTMISCAYSSYDASDDLEVNFQDQNGKVVLECKFKNREDQKLLVKQLERKNSTEQSDSEPAPVYVKFLFFKSKLNMIIEQSNSVDSSLVVFKFTGNEGFENALVYEYTNDEIKVEDDSLNAADFDAFVYKNLDGVKDLLKSLKTEASSFTKIKPSELESGFNIPYMGPRIYRDIESYIELIASRWSASATEFYAPVVIISQASGYGKTRLLYEFGKTHLTIFICLRKRNQNGFPLRSCIAETFNQQLGQSQESANQFFLALVTLLLEEIACLQQANPAFVQELKKDIYTNSIMRRYVNEKLVKIRAAKKEDRNATIPVTDDSNIVDQIIDAYCQERVGAQRDQVEFQVKESIGILNQLLPQLPLPSEINLDQHLQKLSSAQLGEYANVLSIFQPWTRCDHNANYIMDDIGRFNLQKQIKSNDVTRYITKLGQPIFIALDESAYLATKLDNKQERLLFRILSEVFQQVFLSIPVTCLSTSTSQSLADFALRSDQVAASMRKPLLKRYYPPPYSRLLFVDYFANREYKRELRNFVEQARQNNTSPLPDGRTLYSSIKIREPISTLFYFGRPLWFSFKEQKDIIRVAQEKLILSMGWSNLTESTIGFAAIAVLAVRTSFLLKYTVIPHQLSSDLIAKYMATLFHVNDKMTVLSFSYPSEPILAEAAAHLMSDADIFKQIIGEINNQISKSTLTATGELGEFAAQLICLRAKDMAALDLQLPPHLFKSASSPSKLADPILQPRFSLPITVKDYLVYLLGQSFVHKFSQDPLINFDDKDEAPFYNKNGRDENKIKENVKKLFQKRCEFLKGVVCFNHFVKKCDDLQIKGLVHDFVGRCAAGLFINNFPKFDMFIPVLLENGRFTFILISVRNVLDASQLKESRLLSYSDVFPHSKHDTNIRINQDDYCMLLLFDLPKTAPEVSYSSESEAFLVSGLDSFPCLDNQMRELLQKLMDSSRFKRERFNAIAQMRAFPAMYENVRDFAEDGGGDEDIGEDIEPLIKDKK